MFIIRTQKINDEKHRIISYHPQPEKLTDEQKEGTYEVEEMPEKEQRVGESGIRYFNPKTKEVWVEYKERPLSPEEVESEEGQAKIEDEIIDDLIQRGVL